MTKIKDYLSYGNKDQQMSGNRFEQFIVGAMLAFLMAIVVVRFYNALLLSPAAAQPGDLFYSQQQALVGTLSNILTWIVPGSIGAAAVIFAYLRDGF